MILEDILVIKVIKDISLKTLLQSDIFCCPEQNIFNQNPVWCQCSNIINFVNFRNVLKDPVFSYFQFLFNALCSFQNIWLDSRDLLEHQFETLD